MMGGSDSKEVAPPDTVVLHGGFLRGPNAPSLSQYNLKVETYMRFAKIPYKFTDKGGMGVKGKVPWIEYNGESVPDSYFIIQYLNKKFNINLDEKLTDEQKATSTAFSIMTEEFLGYAIDMEMILWNEASSIKKLANVPAPVIWMFRSKVSGRAKSQGIGSHSREEVYQIAERQISALSTLLGKNQYMFGDEPTELDCVVFGNLAQIKWHCEGLYLNKLMREKYFNLEDYLERIKMNFYPDWDELIAPKKQSSSATNGDAEKTKEESSVAVNGPDTKESV